MDRKFAISALISLFILIVTACSGSRTTTTTPVPSPDFSISAGNVSIEEGSTGTVTITITPKDGFSDEVALSIDNPANVETATFAPASAATTSTLTIGSSVAGTYNMIVTGKSGSIEKTAGVTLTVTEKTVEPPPTTTITVNGTVIDYQGVPFNNVPVVILGQDTSSELLEPQAIQSVSNFDGQFSLAGVQVPYDIAIFDNDSQDAVIYKGLTTTNPVLYLINGSSNRDTQRAEIIGTTDPLPSSNHDYDVVFGSPDTFEPQDIDDTTSNDGSFEDDDVDWPGPGNTTTGTVHVLQVTNDGSDYTGYGSANVTLSDGITTTIQDTIELTDIAENLVGGNISFPNGYELDFVDAEIIFDANTALDLDNVDYTDTGIFSFIAPQVPGGTLGIQIDTYNSSIDAESEIYKTGFTLNDTAMNLTVDAASIQAFPANNASNITYSTDFSWTAAGFSNSVYVITFEGNRDFYVVTKDLNTTIPDLSAQGFPLTDGESGDVNSYDWQVEAIGPLTNVDEAATADFAKLYERVYESSDWVFSRSTEFDFEATTP